jgi:hypothetical protein
LTRLRARVADDLAVRNLTRDSSMAIRTVAWSHLREAMGQEFTARNFPP